MRRSTLRPLFAITALLSGSVLLGPVRADEPAVFSPPAAKAAVPPEDWSRLIDSQTGTLPIILTAPHGGREKIDGVEPRKKGVTVRDSNTDLLAKSVARELEKQLGAKPYFVVARVARTYADLNRAEADGTESVKAASYHRAFHHIIRTDLDEIRAHWPGHAILIDIHGQAVFKNAAVRGTRNGRTDAALIARAGKEAIIGPKGLFGLLERAGYETRPTCASADQTEERSFNGGYIVGTYGSGSPNGIDAIQIESGTGLRTPEAKREKYARDLATAIASFYRIYIQAPAMP